MTSTPGPSPSPPRVIPIGPTIEEWRAMAPAERESFLVKVLDALTDPQSAMSEGRPHKKAKTRALDLLGLHFKAMTLQRWLLRAMTAGVVDEVFAD